MGTKAIIYTRQSKHRDESITHELQEQACRTYAAQKGYDVIEILNEKGVSGKTIAKRKEFQSAVKMIESGKAEVLLIWRWSRFARNTLDGLITLKTIEEEAGGSVECATEQIDRSAMGKFSLTMMLGVAEMESSIKGEQWKESLEFRLAQGLPPSGRDYWGYEKVTVRTKNGMLKHTGYTVIPETAEVIRSAMQRVIDGHSLRSTAFWLNDQGHRTDRGDYFQGSPLSAKLKNPFIRGKIAWKGQEFEGAHEPIISESMYRKFLQATKENKAQIRDMTPKSRLIGLIQCEGCGKLYSFMKGVTGKVNYDKKDRFRCATRVSKGASVCSMDSITSEEANNALDWWLPRHWQEIQQAVPQETSTQEQIEEKEAEIETLQAKITQTLLLGDGAGLSPDMLTDALKSLNEQITAAKEELDNLRNQAQVQGKPWWDIEDVIQGEDILKAKMMLKKIIRKIVINNETFTIHPTIGEPWSWYIGKGPNPNIEIPGVFKFDPDSIPTP